MKKYIVPFLYSLSIILISAFLVSIFNYFNIISDKINSILLYIISIISIFIGSYKFTNSIKKRGIICGLIYFGIWFLISIIFMLLIFKANIKANYFVYYTVLLISSILGGIIGKNKKTEIN